MLKIDRRRRGISLLSTIAVLIVVVAATSSQSYAAGQAQTQAAAAALSIFPPVSSTTQDSGVYLNGTSTALKAKTTFAIPTALFRAYANYDYVQRPGTNPPLIDSKSLAWVVSPSGSPQRYGYFPPFTVSILAFGSIPVTATVRLNQLMANGKLQPFAIAALGTNDGAITYPAHVVGEVQLRLTDVTVDQVPLDVGPNCHSSTPVQLKLTGVNPNYVVFYGGPLDGTLDIPTFAGCRAGSDDLDPLLTGMISGPGNPVHLKQGVLGNWIEPDGPCDSVCTPPLPSASPH